MANKPMKKYSTPSDMKGMQTKTILRHQPMPVPMAEAEKADVSDVGRDERNWDCHTVLVAGR